ncbi:hypothetical protein BU25DRAFT_58492 [Macroventuria anomochaeta]|uniref:Uncharacterized protein n=1 Tax=Macroventuria anomochaeta TaxID=301207 RepID=A0ACB6S159_9PLEO|nr:uncharacterized protein BU25DRAFT_58492 [Macroventuria anomochaeta]KAF2627688.1 hypothetical protein BU25DRAFT_58492 [Macroventuria anomochaeta]
MAPTLSLTLAVFLLGAGKSFTAPDQATTQVCTDINNALPGKVLTPGFLALEYEHETQQYWSTTLRSVDSACTVQPTSAEDVAAVVKVLSKYPSVRFATRSGGHDPNVGHATVQGGMQIGMIDLAGASYDADKGLAYVKPGGEWNDVISDLEPSGVAVVGGRLGEGNSDLPGPRRKPGQTLVNKQRYKD